MVFSVMLWAPSWGGMLNGLLTLKGAWNQVRTDPVLKFFAAGVTFYGMATFEGPLLSIKAVNGLAHYTDWIIGHVHSGALGWNGFMAAGMFYWMIPRLYGRELWSKRLADGHFWLGTFGILLYVAAMWVSGITQGLMWRAVDSTGALQYPNFVETVNAIRPMYWMRLVGGTMYLAGMCMMAYNLWRTARAGKAVDGEAIVVVPKVAAPAESTWPEVLFGKPVILVTVVAVIAATMAVVNNEASMFLAALAVTVAILGTIALHLATENARVNWHRMLEGRALVFTVFVVIAVLAGGVAEIVPSLFATPTQEASEQVHPYKPLELEGRDIYIREGCYTCHSQMIRTFDFEAKRYGEASTMSDSMYDHPFQWGSKRTGPDLAREGGKYPNLWHWRHMVDPRSVSPGSIMPPFPALATSDIDSSHTADKMHALRSVGVPYEDGEIASAAADEALQAQSIVDNLRADGVADANPKSELVALVAYLQRLGVNAPQPAAPARAPVSMAR